MPPGVGSAGGNFVGELADWIHFDAIQALVHHATAVISAIFLFGVTGRLIAYLIPNGNAKKVVIIIDDIILLAVFALAGWRLIVYMWVRPHMESAPEEMVSIAQHAKGDVLPEDADQLIAKCRELSATPDQQHQCLKQRNIKAHKDLEAAVSRMSLNLRAQDKAGGSNNGAAKSFDMAQRAFRLYIEAECNWRSASAPDGEAGDIYQACMASLADKRVSQIQQFLRK
jgi:hypothetical protein